MELKIALELLEIACRRFVGNADDHDNLRLALATVRNEITKHSLKPRGAVDSVPTKALEDDVPNHYDF